MMHLHNTANYAAESCAAFLMGIKRQTLNNISDKKVIFNISDIIFETLRIIEFIAIKTKTVFVTDIDDTIKIEGEPRWISQIISNLVINGIDACKPKGGTIIIRLKKNDGKMIKLEVEDDGCGIPEEIISKIFDPFFTTKPFGQGSGLGLSLVHDIVNEFTGKIEVESKSGRTSFKIFIPY
jgi:signal transduction histidine kinase